MYRDHASCILDLAFPQLENQSCVIFDVPGIIVSFFDGNRFSVMLQHVFDLISLLLLFSTA